MLSVKEQVEIETVVRQSKTVGAAVPEALMVVRNHRGWVSDDEVKEIAELLGMSPAEVDSIATFYSQIYRRPVGRHVILICASVSCWIMGYNPIREHLASRLGITLGETTPDNRFTLLPSVCLGACDHAPAMMIDDELFGDLTVERVDEVLGMFG